MTVSLAPSAAASSPFAALWGDRAATLAPALREQYLLRADAPHDVLMTGTVELVWQRPAWLFPFFWALEWTHVLFAATGSDVPATLRVSAARDADGVVRHTWRRTMGFARPRHFDAVMEYDPARCRVVERVGLAGFLEVIWNIQPVSPHAIAIRTEGMSLRVGRWTRPLPRLLCVEVRATEAADPHRTDTVHLDLWMTHPLLGPVFGYRGTFAARRVVRQELGEAEDIGRATHFPAALPAALRAA